MTSGNFIRATGHSSPVKEFDNMLAQKLQDAQYILDLKPDWDENGADPISKDAFNAMTTFVEVLGSDGLFPASKMQSISIDPGDGGSVSLYFKGSNGGAMVEFIPQDDDRIAISYYREVGETGHQGRYWDPKEAATELKGGLAKIV